jgi:hypothetical protein
VGKAHFVIPAKAGLVRVIKKQRKISRRARSEKTFLARLHGCGRYDYMDVIGRIESGTEIESNAWSNCREFAKIAKYYVCSQRF